MKILIIVCLIISCILNFVCFITIYKAYKRWLADQLTIKMLKDMKEWEQIQMISNGGTGFYENRRMGKY
jgi:hypothetical protein